MPLWQHNGLAEACEGCCAQHRVAATGQNHDRIEGGGSHALKADHRRVQLTNNP